MSLSRHVRNLAFAVAAIPLLVGASSAAVFTWDGDGPGTDITTGGNWVGDVAPNTPALTAAPGTHELHFGGTSAVGTTITGPGQLWVDQLIFDSGALAYTFDVLPGGSGTDLSFNNAPTRLIQNSSSSLQTINTSLAISNNNSPTVVMQINTPGAGGLKIGGDHVILGGPRWAFSLGANVTIDAKIGERQSINVYGVNGTSTVTSDTAGTLILNAAAGTGTTNGSANYTGQANIWSGALRVGHADALGATNNAARGTYVHGTFAANVAAGSQNDGTYEHGFGALQLYNGITLLERVRIDSRIGDAADFDHIVNFSDNNILGSSTANQGINAVGGGGHFNFNSIAGKLTIGSALDLHVSDPNRSTGGTLVNSVLTFRGGGDIEMQGRLGQESGFGAPFVGQEGTVSTVLRKQGAGILTVTNATNDWDGGTLIENGSIVATVAGSFSTGGSRVHVGNVNTGSLDVSAAGGLTLLSGKTLSGNGSVLGNVSASGTVSPGGTGGLDGSDLLTVTGGNGTLSLANDLLVNGGSIFNFDLNGSNPLSTTDDLINVTGALNFVSSPAVTVNVSNTLTTTGTWLLIDYGTITGTAPSYTLNASYGAGLSGGIFDNGSAIVLTVVPEPSTLALAGMALVGLGIVYRRRGTRSKR